MSRTVRNWCDICRDLQPDITCSSDGCGKKFHSECLQNAGYWRLEDSRTDYICPDCQEANSNENFCYICKKELNVKKRGRTNKGAKKNEPPRKKAAVEKAGSEKASSAEKPVSKVDEPVGTVPRRSKRQAAKNCSKGDESDDARSTSSASSHASSNSENDEDSAKSVKLKKSEVSGNENYVLCDGCSNSAHLTCLGLEQDEAETLQDDLWFCTECDPNSAAAANIAKQAAEKRSAALKANPANKNKLTGGNVDICYVCQKTGKLLGCDFCEQAFHPRCIDGEFLEFEQAIDQSIEAEKWRCPICKGEDPLKNMAHKRLSRTAMLHMSREWQDCIKTAHRKCRLNRDKFLWKSRDALLPFITQRTITRLKRQFAPNSNWPNKPPPQPSRRNTRKVSQRVDSDDSAESDDTEPEADSKREEEVTAVKAFRLAQRNAKKKGDSLLKEGVHLKSYQVVGVGWLLTAFHSKAGAILADEMGLGKTIQCLTFLSALKCNGLTGPHLIVVPLSTVGNWAREIRRFVPHLKFVKICGSRFEREHTMADPTAAQGLYDLYITTYETVVTEESFFCDSFSWQCLILDEAHRIKNESGRIRHSLDRVAANMRVLLTGTPLQNNVKELFTLLNFLFPDVLKDSDAFEKVVSKNAPNQTPVDQVTVGFNELMDTNAINAVTHLLGKMMLRRTKDLVVRLPRKIEHDIWLPLSPLSAYWYKKLLEVSEAAFRAQSVKKLLGTVVKMRIACCHPRGLVTRDAQLKRFKEVFSGLEDEEVESNANELVALHGEQHIRGSSKLVFLDKLLVQLHLQNLKVSEPYRRDYVQNVKDIYIQTHPPPPPPPKIIASAKPKATLPPIKKATISEARKDNKPLSEPPCEISKLTKEGESDTGVGSDGLSHSEPPGVGCTAELVPKPLTTRQLNERNRKERAVLAAQQAAELEVQLEKIGDTALESLQPTSSDPSLFMEYMKPAVVPDAPLPALPSDAELSADDGDLDDDDDKADDDEESSSNEDEESASGKEDDEDTAEEEDTSSEVVDNRSGDGRKVDEKAESVFSDRAAKRDDEVCVSQVGEITVNSNEAKEEQGGANDENASAEDQCKVEKEASDADVKRIETKNEFVKDEIIGASVSMNETKKEAPLLTEFEIRVPHKVLIFTQFQLVLDELERYCQYRGFKYLRLDGSTNKMIRELDIREFNSPSSSYLVYLICTRAGGVGINLVTANHVVLYDEDWNPFIDLQAIDRAHRIGQKRDVHVWKVITEWTVEERMAVRRMQKLKLDRLLIQANQAAEQPDGETSCDSTAADEKFSVEEIKRLIQHGRTAIQRVAGEDEQLWNKPLEHLISRTRRDLPVITEDSECVDGEAAEGNLLTRSPNESFSVAVDVTDTVEDDAASPVVSLRELDGEDEDEDLEASQGALQGETLLGSRTISTDEATTIEDGTVDDVAESSVIDDVESKKASRRLRRRQPVSFQPATIDPIKPKIERKILHDKKCFKCGSGVNPADENADPLVPCHRCPRVYHKNGCLGYDEFPKRTWTCPWHECCLCFRKGSQAGGLLIYCAECPTTFCFDCFPPEYRRYTPSATYYSDLTKKGYPVSPSKLVLFLCSRCKALKEQERRRQLSRQQLELEAKRRREANLKARFDAHKTKNDLDPSKGGLPVKSQDAKKELQLRKKKIDDLEKGFSRDIRTEYERLFPAEFVTLLKDKKASQAETAKQSTNPNRPPEDSKLESDEKKEDVNEAQVSTAESTDTKTEVVESAQTAEQSTQVDGPQTTGEKPVVKPGAKVVVVKTPAEFCKFCENCHLPGHDAPACPFAHETEKRNLAAEAPITAAIDGATLGEEEKAAEKLRGNVKRLIRSFCPKCGVSSRNHFRRHCDELTQEEQDEYEVRRENIRKFIEELKKRQPIELGPNRSLSYANAESCRRILQKQVDEVVNECLVEAGLKNCVAKLMTLSGLAASKRTGPLSDADLAKNRRKRRADGSALEGPDTGGDTDDPSYSPRGIGKRSRGDAAGGPMTELSAGGEDQDVSRSRRRRPRMSFRDIDYSPDEDLPSSAEEEESVQESTSPNVSIREAVASPKVKPRPANVASLPVQANAAPKNALPPVHRAAGRPVFTVMRDSRLPPSRWHHSPAGAGLCSQQPGMRLPPTHLPPTIFGAGPWAFAPPSMMANGYYHPPIPLMGAPQAGSGPFQPPTWGVTPSQQLIMAQQQAEAWRQMISSQNANPLLRPSPTQH